MRIADEFDYIHARTLELQSEKANATNAIRRCKACGQSHGGHHLETCCYAGVVVEDELA